MTTKPIARADVDTNSELGALKLDEEEIAEFEKWMTEPNQPTTFMVEAAKEHKALRLKLKR